MIETPPDVVTGLHRNSADYAGDAIVTFLGDVFLPMPIVSELSVPGWIVLNLECPISNRGPDASTKIVLHATKNHLHASFGSKVAVTLANNHIMDLGLDGLRDTMQSLRSEEIPFCGAGLNSSECFNPMVLRSAHKGIAVLAYSRPTGGLLATDESAGACPLDFPRVERDIRRSKSEFGADYVVVAIHWGEEEVFLPKSSDVEAARRVIDFGADAVVGHHAHVIQAFEIYNGKPIFYGLGNAVFPDLCVPRSIQKSRTESFYRKKQWPWNRTSLAVHINLETGDVCADVLLYRRGYLAKTKKTPDKYRRALSLDASYESEYLRSVRHGRIRALVGRFLHRPKIVGVRHLPALRATFRSSSTHY